MTIYQAIFKVFSRNKYRLIVSILIMLGVTIFYHFELPDSDSTQQEVMCLGLQDQDQSAESAALTDYLQENANIKVIPRKAQTIEANYFEEIDYYLTIPQNFSASLKQQREIELTYTATANQLAKEYVEKSVGQFIQVYQRNQTTASDSKSILTQTVNELSKTEGLQKMTKPKKVEVSNYVNVLGYCLFFTIFSGYCIVSISFNQRELQARILQGRLTAKQLFTKLSLGVFLYSFFLLIVFTLLTLFLNYSQYGQSLPLYLLNTLFFYFSIVSFSMMICGIFSKAKILNGIKDVYITGICFISGLLIPIDYLSKGVQDIASLTPVYWFARNNRLIESVSMFDETFYKAFLSNLGVVAAFSVLFGVIYLITLKEKGVLVIEQSLKRMGVKE
ncbi:hypothetical protein G15_0804 [Enterococcus avium]|nr:hypothetical protein G15_0804 [Enterococcus avium]